MSEDGYVQPVVDVQLLSRARALLPRSFAEPAAAANRSDVSRTGIYLVGGAVRDLLLGREAAAIDIDLAVDGDMPAVAAALGLGATTPTRFGTLSACRDGRRYDLAVTRAERYAHPGALPEVDAAGIDEDLRRRDFTVNAIALGLSGPRAGELVAVPGAFDDLAARSLAVLHERSFSDDPTRLLRLARYAARLGFGVETHTRELAAAAIAGGALETVSGVRIGNELRLLAGEGDPVGAFASAADIGLPWVLDPELASAALGALPPDGRPELVTLACVFAGHERDALARELDRLGTSAADRDEIVEAATGAAALAARLARARGGAEIARAVGTAGVTAVTLAAARGAGPQAERWLSNLRHRRLELTGSDLIAAGVPEGPRIGRALALAREALMDGRAPDLGSQLDVALGRSR